MNEIDWRLPLGALFVLSSNPTLAMKNTLTSREIHIKPRVDAAIAMKIIVKAVVLSSSLTLAMKMVLGQ
ncbi:hypothetical protein [Paenibacillus andongensis]|uniref:hypothetical protein n=1 Tax=Paenibacillus andongensis TaxID=2975482 RepID=UPI0021BA5D1B|nr:hypothetical protein [Paenibacillus andongensis]